MRNRILMAAADEMMDHGVKFTMSDLARRLSLSKTSIYEHFASKNELVHDVLALAIQDVRRQRQEIYSNNELSVAEKIQGLLKITPKIYGPINNRRISDDLRNYYPHEWQSVSDYVEEFLDDLMDFIVQNIESNVLRPINIPVLREIIANSIKNLFDFRFLEGNNMTRADALASFGDIIVCGLLQPSK